MSQSTDEALRRAVHGLAARARPVADLAPLAIARGRRVRRRRRIVGVAAAVAAFGVLAAPFVWLRPGPGPQLAGPPDPVAPAGAGPAAATTLTSPASPALPDDAWTGAPLRLSDDLIVASATTNGSPSRPPYVFDRTRGRYVTVAEYDELWAAPEGNTAAVYDYSRPGEIGLLDVSTLAVSWVSTGDGASSSTGRRLSRPQWSPDGDQVLLTRANTASATGYTAVIVTVAGQKVRQFMADGERYACTGTCEFTWMPDGKEVVLPQDDLNRQPPEGASPPRSGLQLFAADTGRPTRVLPLKGDVDGAHSWSPDGQFVIVQGQQGARVADVATGELVRTLPRSDPFWLTNERLMYTSTDPAVASAVEIGLTGNEVRRVPLPVQLDGRILTVARP